MAIAAPTSTNAHPNGDARSAADPSEPTTRERLIEAAIEVFLENGYAKTRVQDIALRAGLTTGAMYSHFKNKAALLSEAITQHGDVALNELVDAMGGEEHGPAAIVVGVRALADAGGPADRLMLEALAVSARGDEKDDLIEPAIQRMHDLIAARTDSAIAAGVLDPAISRDALVSFLQRVVLGSIVARAIGLPTEDVDDSEALIRRLLRSLRPDHDARGHVDDPPR